MSLQFNVSSLSQEEIGTTREHAVDCRVLIGDEPSHANVRGDVVLLRTKDGILAAARLTGEQESQCSRCLESTAVPLRLLVEEEYQLSVDPVTGAMLPPPEEPDAFLVNAAHILDMEEAVRQYWTSALPMQPLCRPDCKGLCPECGQNLNERSCSCSPAPDERWGGLRELARELKGTG